MCVQWRTPDGGHRICPKHVEIYSKNKSEELVHLVGLIIRMYYDARSHERQIRFTVLLGASYRCEDALSHTKIITAEYLNRLAKEYLKFY